jgi:hypothetical protein
MVYPIRAAISTPAFETQPHPYPEQAFPMKDLGKTLQKIPNLSKPAD